MKQVQVLVLDKLIKEDFTTFLSILLQFAIPTTVLYISICMSRQSTAVVYKPLHAQSTTEEKQLQPSGQLDSDTRLATDIELRRTPTMYAGSVQTMRSRTRLVILDILWRRL